MEPPMRSDDLGLEAWEAKFDAEGYDHFDTNILPHLTEKTAKVSTLVSTNCLLYFPADRMEEPAWLNKDNLRARPQYTAGSKFKGETHRRIIAHSPLRDVHNWLYDIAYDRAVFEIVSRQLNMPIKSDSIQTGEKVIPIQTLLGYQGDATNAYAVATNILRVAIPSLIEHKDIRFGIGDRHNRVLSIETRNGNFVPNLFQLSSGEMALLALFLSILRDFDLREDRSIPFSSAEDIRGLVVIDEADLHLHSMHQHDTLPRLVGMFPNVQFVMTTHSPLFVLGMKNFYGKDGFEVYDLPTGSRLDAEQFDEFGDSFRAFMNTKKFSNEVQIQVKKSQQPLLFCEGATDCDYLRRAAELLNQADVLDKFDIHSAGGLPCLKLIWKNLISAPEATTNSVVLLYDPECDIQSETKNGIYKRKLQFFDSHPMSKGIENLFDRETIINVHKHHPEFIDIDHEHKKVKRGEEILIPETWAVNEDEKRNLCNWLCEHGTREDFRHFETVLNALEEILGKM